jgi:hypothetical protein
MKSKIVGFVVALVVGLILSSIFSAIFTASLGSLLPNIVLSAVIGILFAVIASKNQFLSYQAAFIGGALVSLLCVVFGLYMSVEIAIVFENITAALDPNTVAEPIDKTAYFMDIIQLSTGVIILSAVSGGGAAAWIASRPKNQQNK